MKLSKNNKIMFCSFNEQLNSIFVPMAIIFFVLWTILAHPAFGSDFYVAPTGIDSNSGTELSPWKTLAKATQTAKAGDIVYIKAGTYNSPLEPRNTGTAEQFITFKGYDNDLVVLDGNKAASSGVKFNSGIHYIRIENLTIKNWGYSGVYYSPENVRGIEIINCHICWNNDFGIRASKAIDCKFINNVIDNNERTGVSISGSTGVIISRNQIYENLDDGISGDVVSNAIIEFNTLHSQFNDYPRASSTPYHSDGISLGQCVNSVIRYNTLYDFTQLIYAGLIDNPGAYWENIDIYGNVFYTNQYYTLDGGEAPAIFIDARRTGCYARNIRIHSNTFGWVGYNAIWIVDDTSGSKIQGITILNNIFVDAGIGVITGAEVSSDYNLFYSTGIRSANPWRNEGSNSLIQQNPQFENYERFVSWDFRLKPTSPAIDSGCPNIGTLCSLPYPFVDKGGMVRPYDIAAMGIDGAFAFDIGAFEFGYSSTENNYTLNITTENGTVTKSPNKSTYTSGEAVTLTATPAAGYTFTGWSGAATGTTYPVTITMNSNKTVTANFVQNPAAITELLNSALLSLLSEQTFNGIDNYKAVSTAGWNLNGTTITLWAKPNDLSVSRYLFGHTVGAWSNRIQLYIREGQLGLGLGNTNTLKQNMAAIQASQWSFISLSFNGTSYTVQVNDTIVGTGTYTGLTQLNAFADIGNTGNPDYRSQEAFSGLIDDVRIYSKVLTAPEVLWLHNIGRNGGLAGRWEFDELKGTLAADASGNNNVGTLINSPAWGRPWAYEEYVRFDGNQSRVEIPATALNANAGAVAMWVYPEDTTGVQFLFRHSRDSANNILLYNLEGSLAVGLGDRPTLKTNIASMAAGRMYHIALTWNGSGYAVYVNGQKKDEGTYTNLTELGTTASIGNYGILPLSTMKIGFKGVVADVQTYNRAITDAEVSNLYYTYDTKENRLLYFTLGQSDSGGNQISYSSVLNLPIGAYFTPETQTFRWRPNYNQAGEYRITFTAQGQPSHTITVDAEDVALKSWYKRFLVFSNKL